MSEWTRIPHDGDYDNLDSTLIIPITQKKVHTQNLPRIIQGEENADILTFETDRFYNGVDLTATVISIIYKNANGTFYERAVNVEYSDDKLRFSWAVSKNATACKGILVINLEFDGLDEHKEVITVKSVRFPIEIEPAVLGKEISAYKSDNWVEETNARVKNLENECKDLSGDITDLDEKLSQKADKDTVASTTQLGMIKLLASSSGVNRSGLIVDPETGVTYVAARFDRGLYRDGAGQLYINPATEEEVSGGTEEYKPVTPKTLKSIVDGVRTEISQKVDAGTIASTTQLGLIKLASNTTGMNMSGIIVNEDGSVSINAISRYGIMLMNGILGLNPATAEAVARGDEQYKPVTPKTLRSNVYIKSETDNKIADLDGKKVDKNTVASTTQLGMIKLLASGSGVNRSGIAVDTNGVAYINARSDRGISRDGAGQLGINPATQVEVNAGTEQYKPVTPKTLSPFVKYSSTPTQVGVWVDGTPIWRVAFDREFTKADAPDIWFDKAFRIIDLIDVWKDYDLVRLFLNSEIEANTGFEATPELNIIDNYACIHDNSYWWDLPENAMLDDDTVLRIGGFVEFVTPASNIKT